MILLSSALGSFIQLLGVLIIFLFVLAITYFTTKWIGNYQKTNFANKNLQIVESIRVGNNKFIAIVKAGEVYLVVAVGKDDVTLLTQLTEEQLSDAGMTVGFNRKSLPFGRAFLFVASYRKAWYNRAKHFEKI